MDPDDQLFGVARLREVLTGQTDIPLDQLQRCVLESVENFARGASQADDVTLLLVRYRVAVARALTETDVPSSASSAASA
jgi:sigma-B regulation protein RsbU (phosphoserine phosphatase)